MESFNIKKIFKNSIWQIGEKIATMFITLFVTALIARYLGVEQYGLINYIISLVSLFTAFSTLGMEKITIKDLISKEDSTEKILGTSFVIRLAGGMILIIISQITLYILNGSNIAYQILGLIIGSAMLFKSFEVIEYYMQSEMNLKLVALIRFVTAIVVAISRILVVVCDLGIQGFACTYLLDAIVAAILFYIYIKQKNEYKMRINKNYAKKILSRCWYVAISGLLTTIYMRIDQVMLGTMLNSTSENGIYSAAVRVAEMWYFVPLAIITAFQPAIMKAKKEENEETYIKTMQRLYDIVAIVGIIFGIVITMFGWIAIKILYGDEYAKASSVLLISVWAGLFATLGSARSVWLITENLQKYTLVYTITGAVVNICLNSIMIPSLGAYGAAMATLLAQFTANVISLIPFKKTKISSLMILKSIFKNRIVYDVLVKIKNKIKK